MKIILYGIIKPNDKVPLPKIGKTVEAESHAEAVSKIKNSKKPAKKSADTSLTPNENE